MCGRGSAAKFSEFSNDMIVLKSILYLNFLFSLLNSLPHLSFLLFPDVLSLPLSTFYFNLPFLSLSSVNFPFLISLPSLMPFSSSWFFFFLFPLFGPLFLPPHHFLFFSLSHSFWLFVFIWLFYGTEVCMIKIHVVFVILFA